ncbi:MAG TPA: M20/M25/M40 family metallo-hydrolase [Blastocatellia bacterium]|nr:M20/M25/M40 family metallo-hydrolase [Blastocatellia bacterium]
MHRQLQRTLIALAAAVAVVVGSSLQARSLDNRLTPDFAAARDEAVQILAGFVRVDTSNPPGNETKGAEYLKAILDGEGIPSEIFEQEPGRGNIVARLKGNGKKRPLLLMGHIDVVGVEREKWTVDPFGGVVKDGYLYGRGSSDDKGMATACLEVFLLLNRLKVPLDRDVIYLAEAGEEGTSSIGIDYMVQEHWDKIECEYALNEGGMIYAPDGKVKYVGIATTEKVPRGFKLVARGTSGHGSVPRPDNAITHLAAAVAKIGNWQAPMRLNETTRAFFSRLAKISPPEEALLYSQLEDRSKTETAQERIRAKNATYNSMLRTSIVPTIIKGGFRSNVIPGDAEATLDVRAVPDEDIEALADALRKLINDSAVEVIPPASRGRPATPPSKLDSDMFRSLEGAQSKVFPGVPTLPLMLTGATDSAQLRAKGVQAYGLGSVAGDRERGSVHGNDERISVEGLGKFVEFIYWAVIDIAASK